MRVRQMNVLPGTGHLLSQRLIVIPESDVTKGDILAVTGADSGRVKVDLFDPAEHSGLLRLVASRTQKADGRGHDLGLFGPLLLEDSGTLNRTAGDPIYADPANPGKWTYNEPDGGGVIVGMVANAVTLANPSATGYIMLWGGFDNSVTDVSAVVTDRDEFTWAEDFIAPAGSTLPASLAKKVTAATGSPTTDYVNDYEDGGYEISFDATSEIQVVCLYAGDNFAFDLNRTKEVEFAVTIDEDGAEFLDGMSAVFGVGGLQNDDPDAVPINAWFRVEGNTASPTREILYESDDGTTDDDDNSTGINYTDLTKIHAKIDFSDLSAVTFYLWDGNAWKNVGSTDMSALGSTAGVQPYFQIVKPANTRVDGMVVDYFKVTAVRAGA